jgi:spectinomycin phosphotransferase
MKFDTSGIDPGGLAAVIRERYGIPVEGLAFVPKGEDAYAFADRGRRLFVRAQRDAVLDEPYGVAVALREEAGFRSVLAPLRALDGSLCFRIGGLTVAVFPWVEGATLWDVPATATQVAQAAAILAEVHGARLRHPPRRADRFDNPFAGPIRRALDAQGARRDTKRAGDVRRLLADEQTSLLAALDQMERLGARCRTLPLRWAVTHGDPNLANFLADSAGRLHLTDWGEVALGPVERDLFFFTGDRFELALRHYGPVPLHEEAFAFYHLRWVVQEIADFTTRILERNVDVAEDEHAWAELTPYLPIRWGDLEAARRRVADTLKALWGTNG